MLPKIDEGFSEDEDEVVVSDFEDIVEEEEELIPDETVEIHEEDEHEDQLWEDDDEPVDKDGRQAIAEIHSGRRFKAEKKQYHYTGSPLRSDPDSDID